MITDIDHTLPTGNPRRPSLLAASIDPLTVDSRGPNGHPVAYNTTGDKVELIPATEDEPAWELPLRRNDQRISDAYNDLWDKVWYYRHLIAASQGRDVSVGNDAALAVEQHYGLDGLELSDFEWGLLSGRMSALAWVLGMEWVESLDT